jgi:hypothetical protein
MFVHPSALPLKRTMDIREPSFDETGAQNAIFRSDFLCIANRPIYFAPQRATSGPRHAPTPITGVVFLATVSSSGAPRHRHVQLEGHFRSLVHAYVHVCDRSSSGVGWSAIIFIASDNHTRVSHIYIYATAILHFITAHTSGHNSGPDALARKQCRAHVLAMLGRALAVGPNGPVPPCPAANAPSPSEPGPPLPLRPWRSEFRPPRPFGLPLCAVHI